jgi:tripartite-type tricarboxylate transporter receptor subunit TctC
MRLIAIAAAFAALLPLPAAAAGYFQGKTVTYIIATNPGGNYDAYGRLVGRHLEKKLGAERVAIKNVPGAGHIVGTNALNAAKPDGLTIGTFNTGLIYAQILNQDGVQFDLSKFGWIGKAAADARAIVLGDNSGLTSFDDLAAVKEPVLFAASGIGSASYNETKMLTDALDLKIEMIPGYQGNEGEMAMLRGEVVGQLGTYGSLKPFVDAGNGFFALAIGGEFKPQAIDYAKTDKARAIVNLIDANSNLGRLTAAPPGVPAEVLEELRDAYMAVMTDPEFLAEAEKLGLPIEPARGDVVEDLIVAALQQSPETVKIIAAALNTEVPTIKVTSKILSLEDSNKVIGFNSGDAVVQAKISGSRTAVSIDGSSAEREALAVGMTCDIEYDPNKEGNEPSVIACKN